MNTRKNARLALVRRLEMVKDMLDNALTPSEAAAEAGVGAPTAQTPQARLSRFSARTLTAMAR